MLIWRAWVCLGELDAKIDAPCCTPMVAARLEDGDPNDVRVGEAGCCCCCCCCCFSNDERCDEGDDGTGEPLDDSLALSVSEVLIGPASVKMLLLLGRL